ncbi:MBL fold metallo-hydrolase [Campylobacter sp. LR196d]|uniref:MBL fold metallo-hydrolase n=1 Tax=Campylobacter sp. LR196d TaxID=2593543 RepID=UPI00123BAE7D|nr:MBL fold metallo-hydrolase [Campylobacter sp. LR196d]KAA6224970.1 MBL fold metallo-hydrolase [Campylobacter sp. LR196d]
MQILKMPCGAYATNCYIIKNENGDIVIDAGVNAFDFISKNSSDVKAILSTHGHFDHVWDNNIVKKHFKADIFIHKDDEFMLNDPFNQGFEKSKADFLISDENEFMINNLKFKFHHFPGHTPGCCMIELVGENLMFSGDFLFLKSIGRWDFPYSDATLMKQSLKRVMTYKGDFRLLPGHGDETSLRAEQRHLNAWLSYF